MARPKLLLTSLYISFCGWSGAYWIASSNALKPQFWAYFREATKFPNPNYNATSHDQNCLAGSKGSNGTTANSLSVANGETGNSTSTASCNTEEFEYLDDGTISVLWSSVNTATCVGGLIGTLMFSFMFRMFDKRDVFVMINGPCHLLSAALLFIAVEWQQVWLIYVSRIFSGLSFLLGSVVPAYLGEVTPAGEREVAMICAVILQRSWTIVGIITNMPQIGVNEHNWHYLINIVPVLLAFATMGLYWIVPRSPKYLYIIRNDEKAAEQAFEFYHGSKDKWLLIKSDMDEESKHGGLPIMNAYSTSMLQEIGVSQKQSLWMVVCFEYLPATLSSFGSMFLYRKFGKRRVFLASLYVFSVCWAMIGIADTEWLPQSWRPIVMLLGICVLYISYTCMANPVVKGYVSEMSPQASLSSILSVSLSIDRSMWALAMFVFPPFQYHFGGGAVLPFIIMDLTYLAFLSKFLPETTGLTVDQVVSRNWNRLDVVTMIEIEETMHKQRLRKPAGVLAIKETPLEELRKKSAVHTADPRRKNSVDYSELRSTTEEHVCDMADTRRQSMAPLRTRATTEPLPRRCNSLALIPYQPGSLVLHNGGIANPMFDSIKE